MKIAKKVLAVAMAVAMIACFAAMAFAAEEKVAIVASEVEDNMFTLTIVVKDGSIKTCDWLVKYDASAVKVAVEDDEPLIYFGSGVGKAVNKGKIMGAFNAETAGEILCGITMTEDLASDVGSSFNAEEGCEFLCIDFELVKADAANVVVTIEDTNAEEGAAAVATATLFAKEEAPSTEAPSTEAPTTEAPSTEEAPSTPVEETKPGVVEGPNTGDTGVLAIAAGVVALAGAAFVVSKKRK